jgi:hypothetical protein
MPIFGTHINTREIPGNAFFYAPDIAGKILLRTFEKLLNVDNVFQPRTWKFLGGESPEVGKGFQNMKIAPSTPLYIYDINSFLSPKTLLLH